ncbi:hypothetical protein Tco_0461095 [Tanacetum coccineum]
MLFLWQLSLKSIVDYKIYKEGKKTYYQIIRVDGSSKMYLVFSHMLKSFDREDLETLWKLVKAKHGSTRPDEGYERVLWGDLKIMFDPHVEDQGKIVGIKSLHDDLGVTAAKLKYDQHAYLGTSHWGPKCQSFYGYASNMTSSKDVYSRRRIIAVTRLKIMKKYDYGHLEEIEVRRDDQKLYTFREGDFKRLCLQDIEDMLLLLVQQKLSNLTIDERYDLNVALRIYNIRIVIQRRVKDLQLDVESYQKKLNLIKPDTCISNLKNLTPYTSYLDPHEMIYVDQFKRRKLMRADELHKFSEGSSLI